MENIFNDLLMCRNNFSAFCRHEGIYVVPALTPVGTLRDELRLLAGDAQLDEKTLLKKMACILIERLTCQTTSSSTT